MVLASHRARLVSQQLSKAEVDKLAAEFVAKLPPNAVSVFQLRQHLHANANPADATANADKLLAKPSGDDDDDDDGGGKKGKKKKGKDAKSGGKEAKAEAKVRRTLQADRAR